MKKEEILRQKGIKVREVNRVERASARTDYQRNANYMVTTSNGRKFYSKNGSLKDALEAEKYATKAPKTQNRPKTAPKTAKVVGANKKSTAPRKTAGESSCKVTFRKCATKKPKTATNKRPKKR